MGTIPCDNRLAPELSLDSLRLEVGIHRDLPAPRNRQRNERSREWAQDRGSILGLPQPNIPRPSPTHIAIRHNGVRYSRTLMLTHGTVNRCMSSPCPTRFSSSLLRGILIPVRHPLSRFLARHLDWHDYPTHFHLANSCHISEPPTTSSAASSKVLLSGQLSRNGSSGARVKGRAAERTGRDFKGQPSKYKLTTQDVRLGRDVSKTRGSSPPYLCVSASLHKTIQIPAEGGLSESAKSA